MPYANMIGYETTYSQRGFANKKKSEKGSKFSAILQQLQKMTKFMKGRDKQAEEKQDFAQFVSFAGMVVESSFNYVLSTLTEMRSGAWVIDTGASRHMCTDLSIMETVQVLKADNTVCLPDGSIKRVDFVICYYMVAAHVFCIYHSMLA
ncbi:hypothetical protein ACS0TY_009079 [Phlomoides rotata]